MHRSQYLDPKQLPPLQHSGMPRLEVLFSNSGMFEELHILDIVVYIIF